MTDAILEPHSYEQLGQDESLQLSETGCGAIILRGQADQLSAALATVGAPYPARANQWAQNAAGLTLWQRPSRAMLLLPREGEQSTCAALTAAGVVALQAGGQYVGFRLNGVCAAQVINAGCSLDLRPDKFSVGDCAGTRIERMPVTLAKLADDDFLVLVERPLAPHLHLWLTQVSSVFEEDM